jgi:type VI secretion system secreted protein Hcp
MANAVEFFLKIDGIQGDSTERAHAGEIQLLSWNWGASIIGPGAPAAGGGTGKPSVAEFSFTASTSQASPQLFQALTTGKVFATATVTGVRTLNQPVTLLEIVFTKVLISSYRISDAAGAEQPIDEVALKSSQVRYTYTPRKADGSAAAPVAVGLDLETNQPA